MAAVAVGLVPVRPAPLAVISGWFVPASARRK